MRRNRSVKKSMLICVLTVVIAGILAYITISFYSFALLQNNLENVSAAVFHTGTEKWVASLTGMDQTMKNMAANDANFNIVKSGATGSHKYFAARDFLDDLGLIVDNNGVVFCYDGQTMHSYQKSGNGELAAAYVSRYLNGDKIHRHLGQEGWQLVMLDSCSFLISAFGTQERFFGSVILLDDHFVSNYYTAPSIFYIYFTDMDGKILSGQGRDAERILADSAVFDGTRQEFFWGEDYLLLGSSLSEFGIQVNSLNHVTELREMFRMQLLVFALILLALALPTAGILVYLQRAVLNPIRGLQSTMEAVQSFETLPEKPKQKLALEVETSYDTLYGLLEKLGRLNMDMQEEHRQKEQYMAQYFQQQLKPHFFLNVMKALYGTAENGDIRTIQQLILNLSDIFTYFTYDLSDTVPLKEELGHIKNYVSIHQYTKGRPVEVLLEVDEGVREVLVPSLALLTFVENSIKYGFAPERMLQIKIQIERRVIDGKSYLHMVVRDNGPGYPDSVLNAISRDEMEQLNGHVGIYNLKCRLSLLYGEDYFLFLHNEDGAVSEAYVIMEALESLMEGNAETKGVQVC